MTDYLDTFREHLQQGAHDARLTIDTATAKWILAEANPRNRPLSETSVRHYVRQMEQGSWRATGDSLKFSASGHLLDGQHRLAAVADAGGLVEFLCVFGLPEDVFDVLDTGRGRSGADALIVAGVRDSMIVSHMIIWMNLFEKHPGQYKSSKHRLFPMDILRLFNTTYQDAHEHINWGRRIYSGCGIGVSQGATLHYAFTRFAGLEHADKFFFEWLNPKTVLASALAARFRDVLVHTGKKPRADVLYATVILAWNLWLKGKRITHGGLIHSRESTFPMIGRPDGTLTIKQKEIVELRRKRDDLDKMPNDSERRIGIMHFAHGVPGDRIARTIDTTPEVVRFCLARFQKRAGRRSLSPKQFAELLERPSSGEAAA